jgi:hypothetical protein
MIRFLILFGSLFFAELTFADINYKCSFYNTKLGVSEEFILNPPQAPLSRDAKIEYRFSGREVVFDFWKASRSGIPDTIAITIMNGGFISHDMQFSYPILKIYWRTQISFTDSENLYCYDLATYAE